MQDNVITRGKCVLFKANVTNGDHKGLWLCYRIDGKYRLRNKDQGYRLEWNEDATIKSPYHMLERFIRESTST